MQKMREKFTKKVTKIKPLDDPTRKPPIGELPPTPKRIPYSEMLRKA